MKRTKSEDLDSVPRLGCDNEPASALICDGTYSLLLKFESKSWNVHASEFRGLRHAIE